MYTYAHTYIKASHLGGKLVKIQNGKGRQNLSS